MIIPAGVDMITHQRQMAEALRNGPQPAATPSGFSQAAPLIGDALQAYLKMPGTSAVPAGAPNSAINTLPGAGSGTAFA